MSRPETLVLGTQRWSIHRYMSAVSRDPGLWVQTQRLGHFTSWNLSFEDTMLKYTWLQQVRCVSRPRVVGSNPAIRAFHVLKPQLRGYNVAVHIATASPFCLETQGCGFKHLWTFSGRETCDQKLFLKRKYRNNAICIRRSPDWGFTGFFSVFRRMLGYLSTGRCIISLGAIH